MDPTPNGVLLPNRQPGPGKQWEEEFHDRAAISHASARGDPGLNVILPHDDGFALQSESNRRWVL